MYPYDLCAAIPIQINRVYQFINGLSRVWRDREEQRPSRCVGRDRAWRGAIFQSEKEILSASHYVTSEMRYSHVAWPLAELGVRACCFRQLMRIMP
jgi:hypothetical protein